jgi:hypothetical protein
LELLHVLATPLSALLLVENKCSLTLAYAMRRLYHTPQNCKQQKAMVSQWSQTSLPYRHRWCPMASRPPGKESKVSRWFSRHVFNRESRSPGLRPHAAALPETSTANINIPNDDPGVLQDPPHAILSTPHSSSQRFSALLGTYSADRAGGTLGVEGDRSQDPIFATSSRQFSSHPETNISEEIKKAWGVTQSGLLTALRLLERSADAFPPLKSAVGGLIACVDLAQVSYSCGLLLIMSNSRHR